jgi:hypothetical protein
MKTKRQVKIVTTRGTHFVEFIERKKGSKYSAAQFSSDMRTAEDVAKWAESKGFEVVA